MTAEIAIMNKEAIALASDSAVTSIQENGQKIFTSANKLFSLSKYHPVGIMIFGSAEFMGVPWETIIKIYRNYLGEKKFDTLKEYVNDFTDFLDNGSPLFPDSVQKEYLLFTVYGYFQFIRGKIEEEVELIIGEKGEITPKDIKKITSDVIKADHDKWKKTIRLPSIPESHARDIIEKYGKNIEELKKEVFEELSISKRLYTRLEEIATSLFCKFREDVASANTSGIVIAGFGEKDIFPSLKLLGVEGVVNNKLIYKEISSAEISFENSAMIMPFAQREMVDTFMEGIDPHYRFLNESYITEMFEKHTELITENIKKYSHEEKQKLKSKLKKLSRKILADYQKELKNHRKETYTAPVMTVVSMLPKDELAAMAESLVNLTSFKRKVTLETETVGGPIDVAVISKGDGFIWIKRKHYFKPELNPQFLANYYKKVGNYEEE
ncbi:hypothetical protein FHEFKHOI_01119 [Candidatus Methanoperedenaceae archaeon GB50]|nr:hypothetical protein AIOGIFDO_01110 [Candidatus Methanoperedenaceae archaeon GB37]CAD7771911.1 hypothetical protein FHEFKHOI_01119 [Candidatus Methanoperedenaceae archaeon GB50]CAD7776657.1 MAG: hypothetical protein KBONHNOK_00950 [Candidatus Methanoperedenaceae archaeon GB50]